MQKTDVKIGRVYRYRSGVNSYRDVRIEQLLIRGWVAKDVKTGSTVKVRRAANLLWVVNPEPYSIDYKTRAAGNDD